jgi:RNA polymerase sigma-70 factor (ECF subfamily)
MLEDRILILRFNRGDAAALRRIYHKYRDDLVKAASALLHDRSAVEDVVHDVFVSFAQESGRFELRGSLKGYLSICVANRSRDRNRSRRRTGVSLDEADLVHSRAAAPDETAARGELSCRVHEAMDLLPDEQRDVIVLRLQSRMRFREIAERKGVSVNTIQSRYRYGLDKLRSLLDRQVKR